MLSYGQLWLLYHIHRRNATKKSPAAQACKLRVIRFILRLIKNLER